ncbi:MAG: PaaI family thioesterase [Phycisphaerae bacterium]|jgi:uncharacterized protein (TIGR00369 family)
MPVESRKSPISPSAAPSGRQLRRTCHPACFACRRREEGGLGLNFVEQDDGSVVGHFDCEERYQSYPDRVHGGVVAMLLDAAMTHCLFHHGVAGVTGRLNVAFREPLRIGPQAEIRAVVQESNPRLYRLRAEVHQESRLVAYAEGKFVPHVSAKS